MTNTLTLSQSFDNGDFIASDIQRSVDASVRALAAGILGQRGLADGFDQIINMQTTAPVFTDAVLLPGVPPMDPGEFMPYEPPLALELAGFDYGSGPAPSVAPLLDSGPLPGEQSEAVSPGTDLGASEQSEAVSLNTDLGTGEPAAEAEIDHAGLLPASTEFPPVEETADLQSNGESIAGETIDAGAGETVEAVAEETACAVAEEAVDAVAGETVDAETETEETIDAGAGETVDAGAGETVEAVAEETIDAGAEETIDAGAGETAYAVTEETIYAGVDITIPDIGQMQAGPDLAADSLVVEMPSVDPVNADILKVQNDTRQFDKNFHANIKVFVFLGAIAAAVVVLILYLFSIF
ncbi:MAG: hypothetical protein FWG03_00630 [Clostridiales bacterium]|nr:hypothetical protein [Clostridiales bacterium]